MSTLCAVPQIAFSRGCLQRLPCAAVPLQSVACCVVICTAACGMWSDCAIDNQHLVLRPGPLSLMSGTVNFGKIWSECGQPEIQYTELIRVT